MLLPEPIAHRFTTAYNARNIPALSDCFTLNAEYHDILYGSHVGRDSISRMFCKMLDAGVSRWTVQESYSVSDTTIVRWSYSLLPRSNSTRPNGNHSGITFEGVSVFEMQTDSRLCCRYSEYFDRTGAAMALGYSSRLLRRLAETVPTVTHASRLNSA